MPPLLEKDYLPFFDEKLSQKQRTLLDGYFIGKHNRARYLAKFAEFDQKGRLTPSWHWHAFLMTVPWLLYRKRYIDAIVYAVAGLSFVQLIIALSLTMAEFVWVRHLHSHQMLVRVVIGVFIYGGFAYWVGRWADAYYYRMARREILDARNLYPQNIEAQKAYLAHHGGVSIWGALLAFALFLAMLFVVAYQFIPIIANEQEKSTIAKSHAMAKAVVNRVQNIYANTGKCPVGLPVSADNQGVSIHVVGAVDGIRSDCAVVASVTGAHFPVRYLNGQTLVLYRTQDGWGCTTSLNKKQQPKGCFN